MGKGLEGTLVGDPSWTPALPTLRDEVILPQTGNFFRARTCLFCPCILEPSTVPGKQQVFSNGQAGRMLVAKKMLTL